MGLIHTEIRLANPRDATIPTRRVVALVDTGAVNLCIPPALAGELQLDELEKRTVVTADGKEVRAPDVGPIRVSFANRSGFTGALVLGGQVLLGAIPIEDMDLHIHPAEQKISVNPAHPDIPSAPAVGVRKAARCTQA